MSEEITPYGAPDPEAIMERVIITGNLAALTPAERVSYYGQVCRSLKINPLTRPFDYIELDGKLTLYACRGATDQLRRINRISISVLSRQDLGDILVVLAQATDPQGRKDEAEGVVSLVKERGDWKTNEKSGKRYFQGTGQWEKLRGEDLARARMRAETKAKRRVTLSICGLGWMDESERDTLSKNETRGVAVDLETGEILGEGGEQGGFPPAPSANGEKMTEAQHKIIEVLVKKSGIDRDIFKSWLIADSLIPVGGHLTDMSSRTATQMIGRWDDAMRRYMDRMMIALGDPEEREEREEGEEEEMEDANE